MAPGPHFVCPCIQKSRFDLASLEQRSSIIAAVGFPSQLSPCHGAVSSLLIALISQEELHSAGVIANKYLKELTLQLEGQWLATSSDCRDKHPHIQQCTGCQITVEKEGKSGENMAKHFQSRPGRDGCQLAWSPPRIVSDCERWRLLVAR